MKIKKNNFDEMQKENRNRIGNQMFILLSYALLIDISLFGFGIQWLKYPSNIMVIILICMGIYLVRTILTSSYLPPNSKERHIILPCAIAALSAIGLVVSFINFSGNTTFTDVNDNSATILFIVSTLSLLIVLIASVVRKISDKKDIVD